VSNDDEIDAIIDCHSGDTRTMMQRTISISRINYMSSVRLYQLTSSNNTTEGLSGES
jgi:hypothetical protein